MRSLIRCNACRSSCAVVFGITVRIVGREIASAIASASIRSFLFDLTKGFTNCAGMIQGVCPNNLAFLAS